MIRITVCILLFVSEFPVVAGDPVYWQEAVVINSMRHWVSAIGDNSDKPVLLFLHGGPGNSVMGYAEKFTADLRRDFVVVMWDQRNSGKTATLSPEPAPVSLEIMKEDGIGVINYLRKRFSQDRIYLAGHSWGGFLALEIAHTYPEVLKAVFAISPMVYQDKSEGMSLDWMRQESRLRGREDALEELAKVKTPLRHAGDLYLHRKWLALLQGTKAPTQSFVETWCQQWLSLYIEASAKDLSAGTTDFGCPVYFFVGSNDRQTHFQITEDYYKIITAEKKDLFWFGNSSHNLNLTEPKKLQQTFLSLKEPEY